MKKESVLLSGATGFLGSHLLSALIEHGYDVLSLKRRSSDQWRIADSLGKTRIFNCDDDDMERIFSENRIDIILHTAANYGRGESSLEKIAADNLLFSLKLLELGRKYQVSTFVNTDTLQSRYVSAYTLTKRQFHDWFRLMDDHIQIINLKIDHMYGPKDDGNKFPVWFLDQLRNEVPEIALTEGTQQRDFVYIGDVVSAFLRLLSNRHRIGRRDDFEVGTGTTVSVRQFVILLKDTYCRLANRKPDTRLGFGRIPLRQDEPQQIAADISKLKMLGWKPQTGIESGIELFVDQFIGEPGVSSL